MDTKASAKAMTDQVVLVSGAAGFIGTCLTRRLLELDADVHVLIRPTTDRWRLVDVLPNGPTDHPTVRFVAVDIDESPRFAAKHGVLSIPTALLFEGGERRSEVIGAYPRSHYEKVWAGWLRPGG